MSRTRHLLLHAILLAFAFLTLVPFLFVCNNLLRTNSEYYQSFFSLPESVTGAVEVAADTVIEPEKTYEVLGERGAPIEMTRGEVLGYHWETATRGIRLAWSVIRPYMLNSFIVSGVTAFLVLLLSSVTAYILARYRFPGRQAVFLLIISTMMFPAVLTLVPSFLLVKELGLLNTYWAMILPYVAGGQVFATFVFKSFFEGLDEALFEAARIDGAGHFRLYWEIVLPLSKPVFSVVLVMNILGTWNTFLWPFIVNTEGEYHVIASGLYVLATSTYNQNFATLYSAYMLSSIPLLILFIYATKPFIQGMTTGALKA